MNSAQLAYIAHCHELAPNTPIPTYDFWLATHQTRIDLSPPADPNADAQRDTDAFKIEMGDRSI